MANAILNFHFDYWHTSLTGLGPKRKFLRWSLQTLFFWRGTAQISKIDEHDGDTAAQVGFSRQGIWDITTSAGILMGILRCGATPMIQKQVLVLLTFILCRLENDDDDKDDQFRGVIMNDRNDLVGKISTLIPTLTFLQQCHS